MQGLEAARGAYEVAQAKEAQLKALSKSKNFDTAAAYALQDDIRHCYADVLAADPLFAATNDVEMALWRSCYYKRIEDFRKRTRKYANHAVPSGDALAREHLHRICMDFQRFLADATAFYATLLTAYDAELAHLRQQQQLQLAPHEGSHPESARIDKLSQSIHRCLIFMGDLARYRELHSEAQTPDWSHAEQYYQRALAAMPHGGNPHNQMAVLATYTDAECVAVYRYCRSLLIRHPFMTARDNLALLFEKNKQKLAEEEAAGAASGELRGRTLSNSKSGPIVGANGVVVPGGSSRGAGGRGNTGALLKSFLRRFVRLHGILFSADPEGLAQFGGMFSAVICDFRTLLYYSAFGDALLLKMVVICTFTVIVTAAPSDVASDASRRMPRDTRATCLSWALALAFGIAAQIGGHVRTHNPQWPPVLSRGSSDGWSEGEADASAAAAAADPVGAPLTSGGDAYELLHAGEGGGGGGGAAMAPQERPTRSNERRAEILGKATKKQNMCQARPLGSRLLGPVVLFCDWLEVQPEFCLPQEVAAPAPAAAAAAPAAAAAALSPASSAAADVAMPEAGPEGSAPPSPTAEAALEATPAAQAAAAAAETPPRAATATPPRPPPLSTAESGGGSDDDSSTAAAADALDDRSAAAAQERARRVEFWDVVCHLANALPSSSAGAVNNGDGDGAVPPLHKFRERALREHVELRGYTPLHDLYQRRYPDELPGGEGSGDRAAGGGADGGGGGGGGGKALNGGGAKGADDDGGVPVDDRAGAVRIKAIKAFCNYMSARGSSSGGDGGAAAAGEREAETRLLICKDAANGLFFTAVAGAARADVAAKPLVLKQVPFQPSPSPEHAGAKGPPDGGGGGGAASAAAAKQKAAAALQRTGSKARMLPGSSSGGGSAARKLGRQLSGEEVLHDTAAMLGAQGLRHTRSWQQQKAPLLGGAPQGQPPPLPPRLHPHHLYGDSAAAAAAAAAVWERSASLQYDSGGRVAVPPRHAHHGSSEAGYAAAAAAFKSAFRHDAAPQLPPRQPHQYSSSVDRSATLHHAAHHMHHSAPGVYAPAPPQGLLRTGSQPDVFQRHHDGGGGGGVPQRRASAASGGGGDDDMLVFQPSFSAQRRASTSDVGVANDMDGLRSPPSFLSMGGGGGGGSAARMHQQQPWASAFASAPAPGGRDDGGGGGSSVFASGGFGNSFGAMGGGSFEWPNDSYGSKGGGGGGSGGGGIDPAMLHSNDGRGGSPTGEAPDPYSFGYGSGRGGSVRSAYNSQDTARERHQSDAAAAAMLHQPPHHHHHGSGSGSRGSADMHYGTRSPLLQHASAINYLDRPFQAKSAQQQQQQQHGGSGGGGGERPERSASGGGGGSFYAPFAPRDTLADAFHSAPAPQHYHTRGGGGSGGGGDDLYRPPSGGEFSQYNTSPPPPRPQGHGHSLSHDDPMLHHFNM